MEQLPTCDAQVSPGVGYVVQPLETQVSFTVVPLLLALGIRVQRGTWLVVD